ncbi:sulfotransferase 1C4-like [Amphiura filiformis]|uniref:sulfotransferase 1C4-like n=1 Tax=Amphiura filiformis TaxID=82378 RepID=UPI003B228C12
MTLTKKRQVGIQEKVLMGEVPRLKNDTTGESLSRLKAVVKVITASMKDDDKEIPIHMYEYKGVYFSDANVEKDTLESLPQWEARADDVYVVSYPKAGTTWTQEIMYLALNGGDIEKAKQAHTMIRVPYMEAKVKLPKMKWFSHPLKSLLVLWCLLKIWFKMFWFNMSQGEFTAPSPLTISKMLPSPRFMKSHLPEHLLPSDIYHKKAKIVYVARNPKDMAVSFYHFHRWQTMLPKYETWDRFFDDFMEGKVSYGKWYEHYLGYWRRRHEESILFLKYEDMKKDEKAAVRQICEFLGYHYSDDILDRITQHSTFGSMKKNPMTNPDFFNVQREGEKHISFMRKGVVGDWKNYFTDEQNKAFDKLYEEKLSDTGLTFDFE